MEGLSAGLGGPQASPEELEEESPEAAAAQTEPGSAAGSFRSWRSGTGVNWFSFTEV